MKQAQSQDNAQLYHQTVAEFFGKVLKILPKNKKDLKTDIEKILAPASKEKEFTNANALIKVMKDLMDLKVTKITEFTLAFLEKLVSLGMIDGHEVNIISKKKCVDEVLQMIVECIGLREDSILFLVIKALHSLTLVPFSAVYGDNLEFIVQALISIYSQNSTSSKNTQISGLAMLSLRNIVRRVFERMERYSETTVEQEEIFCLKRCITVNRAGEFLFQDANLPNNHNNSNNFNINSNTSLFQSNSTSPRQSFSSLKEAAAQYSSPSLANPSSSTDLSEQEALDPTNFLSMPAIPYPGLLERPLNFEEKDLNLHISTYCDKQILNLVDQTVLFDERSKRAAEDIADEAHVNVPIQSVPPQGKENTPEFAKIIQVNLANEANQIAGKFGWCFVCRQKAEYYCKQTRVPICSQECKQTHLTAIDDIQYMLQNKYKSIPKDQYYNDGVTLFKFLCNLSKRDGANLNSQMNPQSLKSKVISLEMLKLIMENSGVVFLSSFAGLVKDSLVHSVLVNSVSQELRVVQLSLQILSFLFIDFRDILKKEIEMFMKDILLRMLESSNTGYSHRLCALNVFETVFKQPRFLLEIFVNFDCQLNLSNLAQTVIEQLSKIAQGKYAKTEFNLLIQRNQEQVLRDTALATLVVLQKNLLSFTIMGGSKLQPNDQNPSSSLSATPNTDELQSQPQNSTPSRSNSSQEVPANRTSQPPNNLLTIPNKNPIKYNTAFFSSPQSSNSPKHMHNLHLFEEGNSTSIPAESPILASPMVSQELAAEGQSEEHVQESKKRKKLIQKCIQTINFKLKEGIAFGFDNNIFDKPDDIKTKPAEADEDASLAWQKSVNSVADFFYNQRTSLSRISVGRFFGEEQKFNQEVFQQYLLFIDMSNLGIVEALRMLFKIIYPPGEAEAMDRIIEQFGEKYIRDNPEAYKNAGVTYTLAFAIMMLQTNLYNQTIKEKDRMDLLSFSRLVKGINDGEDLPAETVLAIFSSVKEQPLGIHDSEEYKQKMREAISADVYIKTKKFKEEQQSMLVHGQLSINSGEEDDTPFARVLSGSFTRDVLEVIWSPLFATFSSCLESTEEQRVILACLDGMKFTIALLGRCGLDFEQETFIVSLTKNTGLSGNVPLSAKNILACSCVIGVASTSGNWLRQSWKSVLACLSKIDYYQSADFVDSDFSSAQILEAIKINQRLISLTVSSDSLDKVFSGTYKYESEGIESFIEALCKQCSDEIQEKKSRVLSIHRISEVAEFNMDRVRYQWNKIWQTLSQLFQQIATTATGNSPLLVVDLLKQLSMKFLQKTELSHYSFQRVFLQPFLFISRNTRNQEVLELILSCIKMIASLQFTNLKSGWSVIINVVNEAVDKKIDSLTNLSSQIIDDIFIREKSLENLSEVLLEVSDVLCKLVLSSNESISLNSISNLNKLISYLMAYQKQLPRARSASSIAMNEARKKRSNVYQEYLAKMWLPVLKRLSEQYKERRLSVQRKSIETLFSLLKQYGSSLHVDFWQKIMSEILDPFFESLCKHQSNRTNQDQYVAQFLKESIAISFESLITVFTIHFSLTASSLSVLLAILRTAITTYSEIVPKIAGEAMTQLILRISGQTSPQQFDEIIAFLEDILDASLPLQLLDGIKKSPLFESNEIVTNPTLLQLQIDMNYKRILSQVMVQLITIAALRKCFQQFTASFSDEHIEQMITAMVKSYNFATSFNGLIYYRYTLLQNGFMSESKFPNLMIQERDSREMLLEMLFEKYLRETAKTESQEHNNCKQSLGIFLDASLTCIQRFVECSSSISDGQETNKKWELEDATQSKDPSLNFQKYLSSQERFEKNKTITNLRTTLSSVILPKILLIPIQQYADRLSELIEPLIDLSSFSFSKNLLSITCSSCTRCEMCKTSKAESFDQDIKKLLKMIFQYIAQYLPVQQLKEKTRSQSMQFTSRITQNIELRPKDNSVSDQSTWRTHSPTKFSRGLAEIASKVEEGQLSDTQAVKEEKQSTNNQNVPGEEQQTLNQQDTEITAVENNNDSNNNDKENQKEQQSKERSQIIGNDGDKENTVDATEETNAKEDQAAMIEQKVEIKEELSNPSQQESQ